MHQDDDNNKELNYVAKLILQTFKDTGLDNTYIQDKAYQFQSHDNKYESLIWAINQLDNTRTAVFADKLGVSVAELYLVKQVLDKC